MNLIIGYGEIGQAVGQIVKQFSVVDTAKGVTYDPALGVEVMHICFPPSETFIDDVNAYIAKYDPTHVIVWSSTAIGTCASIGDWVIHSPVEGKHPLLEESISRMIRWFGCFDKEHREWAEQYFISLGLYVKTVEKSEYTEALKLLSTSEYGVNILFAAYKKWVAETLGMDYELMKDWNWDYNELYRSLMMSEYQKFVLDPPEGPIGGHCIRPNAELLNSQFPHEFLKMIREFK